MHGRLPSPTATSNPKPLHRKHATSSLQTITTSQTASVVVLSAFQAILGASYIPSEHDGLLVDACNRGS